MDLLSLLLAVVVAVMLVFVLTKVGAGADREPDSVICTMVVPECPECAPGKRCVIHGQTRERCSYAACE